MPKKIRTIFIVAIILIIILGGLGWYFLFFKGSIGPNGEQRSIRDFFPFGKGEEPIILEPISQKPGSAGAVEENVPLGEEGGELPVLRKISKNPTAGAYIFSPKNTDRVFIRFVDRASGHIFEAYTDSLNVSRISNTTIPKIFDALWVENGEGVIFRYLDNDMETIQSFYGRLEAVEGENAKTAEGIERELGGNFLPDGITSIAASPDTKKVAYVVKNKTGSVVIKSAPDGKERKQLIATPLSELLISWPEENKILLQTKASYKTSGFLFEINKGLLNRITDSKNGLITLANNNGNFILYGDNNRGVFKVFIKNTKSKAVRAISINTFPEKCVWSRKKYSVLYCAASKTKIGRDEPDVWYKGISHYSDDIWRMDAQDGSLDRVISIESESGSDMDIINPILGPNEEYLIFTDKNSLNLWLLKL